MPIKDKRARTPVLTEALLKAALLGTARVSVGELVSVVVGVVVTPPGAVVAVLLRVTAFSMKSGKSERKKTYVLVLAPVEVDWVMLNSWDWARMLLRFWLS